MKINKLMLGLVAGCLGVVTSQAVPMYGYTDHDILNAPLAGAGDSVSGEFNIVTGDGDFLDAAGYDPVTQTITDAVASFSMISAQGGDDTKVSIDLADLFGEQMVGLHFTTIGGAVTGLALSDLDVDGILDYTIRWVSGGPFIASDAILSANATRRPPTDVPDGGATVGLLGLGLAAVGFGARRRK